MQMESVGPRMRRVSVWPSEPDESTRCEITARSMRRGTGIKPRAIAVKITDANTLSA